MNEKKELSFGQKAVGLQFPPTNEAKRHASIAITDIETAHLRTVQSLIWVE